MYLNSDKSNDTSLHELFILKLSDKLPTTFQITLKSPCILKLQNTPHILSN